MDAQWGDWKYPSNQVEVNKENQTVLFLEDERVYSSPNVQVDEAGPRPRYCFKKNSRSVESTRISTAILPVREDFAWWTLPNNSTIIQFSKVF